jgi:hypothetical protein
LGRPDLPQPALEVAPSLGSEVAAPGALRSDDELPEAIDAVPASEAPADSGEELPISPLTIVSLPGSGVEVEVVVEDEADGEEVGVTLALVTGVAGELVLLGAEFVFVGLA